MKKFLLLCSAMILTLSSVWAQERTVSGRVTSTEDGSALPGVNVVIKGTTNGTVTDSDGNYKLNVPAEGSALVFSFIGLQSQEIVIGDRSVVDVSLALDVTQLSEVVVTAFGIEREKKALGFSVSQVNNDELVKSRSTNIANALTAKVAGLRIQGSNGMVGSSSNIFIRGFTTFTGSNQPLFVVDGIPIDNGGGGNGLQAGVSNSNRGIDLNQEDIESLSVLKGPAAAVLYGSRAAAGAIIITTKKGVKGENKKNVVTYTSAYTIAEPNRLPDYQNKYAQGDRGVFNPLSINSWGPEITGQTVTNFRGESEVLQAYPDNVKDIFKKGDNFQNNLSFSGATDKSSYFVSYGNVKETGILDNNELARNTFTFNGSTAFTEKLKSTVSAKFINNVSSRTQQGNQLANPFFRSWFLPRSYNLANYPIQNADGSQKSPSSSTDLVPSNTWYGTDDNPLWTIKNNTYDDEVNRFIGNLSLSYQLHEKVSLDYRLGTDTYTQTIKVINARTSRGGSAAGQTGAISDQKISRQETSSYLNLRFTDRLMDDNIGVNVLLGNEVNARKTTNYGVTGNNLQITGFENITNTLTFNPFGTLNQQRLVGFYVDAQFDYKNAVFLGLTGRNDYSSAFRKENRSYFYPSVTTSVILTDLVPALADGDVLTFAKIRANVATVGREAGAYNTDTYFSRSAPADGFGPTILFPFQGLNGQSLDNTAGDPQLGPEFTTTYEVGADVRLFNNKIGLDVAYFNQASEDIIFAVPVAAGSGFTNQTRNIGKSESQGFEVQLTATPVNVGNFKWEISANWSRIRNTVIELAPGVDQITLGGFVTPSTRLIAGQPYGVIFGSVLQRNADGRLLIDANGRANLATANQIVGDPNPNWFGGITNTFSWKGLSFSTLVDIRYGGDIISRNISDLRRSGAAAETADRERLYIHDGVLADGTPNNITISAQDYFDDLYGFGRAENVVFDATWVRLREAAITYTLPKSLTSKTPFGSIEVGVNGRNLLLYAPNVPHIDPEVNAQGQSNSQGLEFNGLPQTRTYGATLKLTF